MDIEAGRPGKGEFIFLMAVLMSLAALAIDAMLPALGQISESFGLQNENESQWVISSLLLGMSFGFLFFGPLSDSIGRKPTIYLGVGIFLVGDLVSIFAGTFEGLIFGRILQGLGASSCRVVCLSMVRDRFSGRHLAQAMSLIIIVFILVPALAPSLGQLILLFSGWQSIFWSFFVVGITGLLWLSLRQPETHKPENRRPFSFRSVWSGVRETLAHPVPRGYMVVHGLVFAGIVGYLNSAQQILQVQYDLGRMFAVYFGAVAASIGFASFSNSKLVMRYGMIRLCVSALVVKAIVSTLFFAYVYLGELQPPLPLLLGFLLIVFFCIGILFGNLNALALDPMGHIAGTANAVVTTASTLIGMGLGATIGQMYDGTVIPLVFGFAMVGVLALAQFSYTVMRSTRD